MRLLILTLILALASTGSWAIDSIGPVFQNVPEFKAEYYGQKDRYSVALLQNDPEVLVAKAQHESRQLEYQIKESVITPIVQESNGITVSSCVEYNGRCQQSKEFTATIGE